MKEDLWVITSFFNPNNYKNKIDNYRFFRKKLVEQNVKLLTVECALKNNSFELNKNDADILIKRRSESLLWHKERLLNIGLDFLPKECTKVVWLDADIIFLDNNWAKKVSNSLNTHPVIKPFNKAIRLNQGQTKKLKKNFSFFINNFKNKNPINIYEYKENKNNEIFYALFGLAAKKELIKKTGFYDKMITGSGDRVIANAFLQKQIYLPELSKSLKTDIEKYNKKVYSIFKTDNIPVLDLEIVHLFHGLKINRGYDYRFFTLKKYNFNPNNDIKTNTDGCLEWTNNNNELENQLIHYFKLRNEENKFYLNIKHSIYITIVNTKHRIFKFLDKCVGLVGIFLKRFFPKTYYKLKRCIKLKIY